MDRKFIFSQDSDGNVTRLKADPANIDKQMNEERAAGRTPMVLDDDDMIRFGLLSRQIRDQRQ